MKTKRHLPRCEFVLMAPEKLYSLWSARAIYPYYLKGQNYAGKTTSLQWRHEGHESVSNHDCLLNRLFRRRSKKISKLRVTGLCAANSPGTGEFPAQMASYVENVSIWWRNHGFELHAYGYHYRWPGHWKSGVLKSIEKLWYSECFVYIWEWVRKWSNLPAFLGH